MKKTHNVQRNGTRKGGFRRKKELALALCVSLWIAGGGVAAAAELYLQPASPPTNPQTYIVTPNSGYPAGATVNSNGLTLAIDGGTWDTDWTKIYAGKGNLVSGYHSGDGYLMKDNCTLNVKNATFEKSGVELYGANNQVNTTMNKFN